MLDSRFVKELTYGMTDAAIRQAQRIHFIPRNLLGAAAAEPVNVITQYSFGGTAFPTGCGSINVTVFDKTGELWRGETAVHKCLGMR